MKEQEFFKLKNRVERMEQALVGLYNQVNGFQASVANLLPQMPGYDQAVEAVKKAQDDARKEADEKAKELMVDVEEVKPESNLIIEEE